MYNNCFLMKKNPIKWELYKNICHDLPQVPNQDMSILGCSSKDDNVFPDFLSLFVKLAMCVS